MSFIETIALHETARARYLNYAVSVITSRALPDLRDGLKPVQRRILYAMYVHLRLTADGRPRKCATIVGDVMGKLHPHGDTAIYDALARMAQDFSLRAPLVDGQGNFGSIDGDNPAAMRYTEARLTPLAAELLSEIKRATVAFRPTFDGTLSEPVVLPARFPNLLVNGATGIAVGMATNIPPHNLGEVLDALELVLKRPDATLDEVLARMPGPDFPTGGRLLSAPDDLRRIYERGEGPLELRGEWTTEGQAVILTSVPYGVAKADLVEEIGALVGADKVPQIADVRDESTDIVRVVLELKKGASAEAAMAYLCKHTRLQTRIHANLTCLVPTEREDVSAPQRVDLMTILRGFLAFRLEVVTKRLAFDLGLLRERIHILEGLETIFHALDECIKIIRGSKDRRDAAQRLIHRFGLSDEQADAILDLKLYRLARLEIEIIETDLAQKRAEAARLDALLADESARWKTVQSELREIRKTYADARRTTIAPEEAPRVFNAEDYIVAEDVVVIVTRDGWVKRQRSYTDVSAIRVRDGDAVGWVLGASTRATVAFATSVGKVYTVRVEAIAQTTGHGEPVQKLFDFADRETVVGVVAFDERVMPVAAAAPAARPGDDLFGGDGALAPAVPEGPTLVGVSRSGQTLRLPVEMFAEPSNKTGRAFLRHDGTDALVMADIAGGDETLCLASRGGHVLIFPVAQIPTVKGAAKGVVAMRLHAGDAVLGATLATGKRDGLEVETNRGRREIVRATKFEVASRGGRGKAVVQRGSFTRVVPEVVVRNLDG